MLIIKSAERSRFCLPAVILLLKCHFQTKLNNKKSLNLLQVNYILSMIYRLQSFARGTNYRNIKRRDTYHF